jgi:hypothetical protein
MAGNEVDWAPLAVLRTASPRQPRTTDGPHDAPRAILLNGRVNETESKTNVEDVTAALVRAHEACVKLHDGLLPPHHDAAALVVQEVVARVGHISVKVRPVVGGSGAGLALRARLERGEEKLGRDAWRSVGG